MRRLLSALGVAAVLLSTSAGAAETYEGPPTPSTRYWTAPAWKEFPLKGPGEAAGIVIWSHGVKGREQQYQFEPPPTMKRLARMGYDVLKIQRNGAYEDGWDKSGAEHVANLLDHAARAKREGYKRIVLAGQSYGGAISLEAGARLDGLHAVLAFAPGHGSDAPNPLSRKERWKILSDLLVDVVQKQRKHLVLVSVAADDHLHPETGRGARVREALAKSAASGWILFDETMPVRGHSAALTQQFNVWFGGCIATFVARAAPGGRETVCEMPKQTSFLLPSPLLIVAPDGEVPAALAGLSGQWQGKIPDGVPGAGREICFVVERMSKDNMQFLYAHGSGPGRSMNMTVMRRNARLQDDRYAWTGGGKERLYVPAPRSDALVLEYVSADGTWSTPIQMRRQPCQ